MPIDIYSRDWDLLAEGIIIDGRPKLGFNVVDNTNEIEEVDRKGAADTAGIKAGDFIIRIGGIDIEDKEDIATAISELDLRPNSKTEIVVRRGKKEETLKLTVDSK